MICKKPENSLIISQNFYPVEGGIQTYMYELASNRSKGKVTVVCYREDDESLSVRTGSCPFLILKVNTAVISYWKGLKTIRVLLKAFSLASWKLFFILACNRSIIKSITPLWNKVFEVLDSENGKLIIHCSKPVSMGVIGVAVKLLRKSPVVVYVHGNELQTNPSPLNLRQKNLNMLIRFVLNEADLVIANSSYTKSLAERFRLKNNVEVVNLGAQTNLFYPLADTEKVKEEICKQYNIPTNAKILLTVSHLIARKGNDTVIKALSKLKDDNVYYLIVGKGDYEKNLRKLAEDLSVEKRVIFCGHTSGPDLRLNDYMNICDIFVMPCRKEGVGEEGYGIVFIEANACGKAVIGGRIGGVTDAVIDGETGYLVDPESVDELTGKISHLLKNPDIAAEMGSKGLQRVRDKLNWTDVCRKVNLLIEERIIQRLTCE